MINTIFVLMNSINRQKINNCYTTETYLELDTNQETFTILLVSAKNINCNVFPSDVYVNLTLPSPFIKPLQTIISSFNYSQTEKIQIPIDYSFLLPGSTIDQYALINFAKFSIYSLSEITEQEIMTSFVKKSNLQQCFAYIELTINVDSISMSTTPLSNCKLQISNTNSESKLTKMAIIINDIQFDYDSSQLQNFIDCYQQPSCFNVQSIINTDLSKLILEPFHTAKLKLLSHQGTIDVAIEYPIKYIHVSSTDNYFQQSNSMIYIQNNSFIPMVEIDENTDISNIQQKIDQMSYTKVIQRLSCKLNSKQFTYQTVTYGYFNVSQQQMIISCNEGSPNQQQYCKAFYDYAYDNIETQCYLDIQIYNGDVCDYIEKIHLFTSSTCFQKFWVSQEQQQTCVEIEMKQQCQPQNQETYLVYLVLYENKLYYKGGLKNQYGMVANISSTTTNFCFNCSQYIDLNDQLKCNETNNHYIASKNTWRLSTQSYFQDLTNVVLSKMYIKTNYSAVSTITLVLGFTILIISVSFCILQIKQTQRIIAEVKNKKAVKL
ncbi:Conserved_hypothetical protein [Hexamita inflata]|uniref:Transmembrane protein n=1 Tax=Hexamita inflata TaxID=28002 RepID=A0AA86NTK2_9EUKA|nr:Conserved hypothetical protein [Hexamita inflata]